MELRGKKSGDARKSSEAQNIKRKASRTSEDRLKENLRYFLKGEVIQQVEQSRQVEVEKQNERHTSIISD